MTPKNPDERGTAFHEAAHAVAIHYLLDPKWVGPISAIPEAHSLGRGEVVGDHDHLARLLSGASTEGRVGFIRAGVIVRYAGAAAELRLNPSSPGGWIFDEPTQEEEAAAKTIGAVDRDDRVVAESFLASPLGGVHLEERGRVRQELQDLAHLFVREHWTEIEALAEKLLKLKTMTAAQVRRAIRGGRRPGTG